MSFAALTQPDIAKKVEAAALLSPISYLEHITAPLVRLMVDTHLDTVFLACYCVISIVKCIITSNKLVPIFFSADNSCRGIS